MNIDMALCEKILETCMEKYGQESFLGYTSSIHPVLLRKAQSADELIWHFLWLESENLVYQVCESLSSNGQPRRIISLTAGGHRKIIQQGLKNVLNHSQLCLQAQFVGTELRNE
ncbi:hypothetical protein ABGT23_02030 [Enterobacter cloacae]|uniref:hypothetical protein n=1 Tax=Enterobacter cloacae TaxID=550 RepID=UPI00345CAC27